MAGSANDYTFVTAKARDEIVTTHYYAKRMSQNSQRHVSHRRPARVVNFVEEIQTARDAGDGLAVTLLPGALYTELCYEDGTVWKSGDPVALYTAQRLFNRPPAGKHLISRETSQRLVTAGHKCWPGLPPGFSGLPVFCFVVEPRLQCPFDQHIQPPQQFLGTRIADTLKDIVHRHDSARIPV